MIKEYTEEQLNKMYKDWLKDMNNKNHTYSLLLDRFSEIEEYLDNNRLGWITMIFYQSDLIILYNKIERRFWKIDNFTNIEKRKVRRLARNYYKNCWYTETRKDWKKYKHKI